MTDIKGNLYLFEAIELRNLYDRHIKLLQNLLNKIDNEVGNDFSGNNGLRIEPVVEFNSKDIENNLKKLKFKRIKLNQAIQLCNLETKIKYNENEISISEALEIKKNLLSDIKAISNRIKKSAYKSIIHKEKRDIIKVPNYSFSKEYSNYQNLIKSYYIILNKIHNNNHQIVVKLEKNKR